MSAFSHLKSEGGVTMVDVSEKSDTMRTAVAAGRVMLGRDAFEQVRDENVRKGDVLTIAQIAGIMGAKATAELIPLCHHVNIQGVDVELTLDEDEHAVEVRAFAKSVGPTGVEMEALTGVSIACLTVYDMCKSISREIIIQDIRLLAKTGGQSGDYRRRESN